MKRVIPLFLVFIFQLFLTLHSTEMMELKVGRYFSPFTLPYLLLFSTILLTVLYFRVKLKTDTNILKSSTLKGEKLFGSFVGVLGIGLLFFVFYGILAAYPDSGQYSDVMPQIETLYHRFVNGEQPYQDVPFKFYSAYPVYMPLHWLPIGITDWMGIDARWVGYIFLLFSMLFLGRSLIKSTDNLPNQVMAIAIVVLPILAFFIFAAKDISLSLETVIAAYYLILVAGLIERNLTLITLGIILIILSRYTFIFWLPTLGYLFLRKLPFGKNMVMLGAVVLSIVFIYIIPFIAKDPSIFPKGIAYHQKAVFDEWRGYGNPSISYTMENGLNFAGNLKRTLSGPMEERAQFNRKIQAGMLLLTMFIGLLAYHTKLKRLNMFDFSLGMLYVFIMIFFIFSPLTYLYYLLVPMVLGAVLVADVFSDNVESS